MVSNISCRFGGPLINFRGHFVVDRSCKFLGDDVFGCDSVEFAFPFNIYQPFPILIQCLTVFLFDIEEFALLWKAFLVGKKVFLNSLKNSCRLISFSSFPHWPPMISCFAFGPSSHMTSPLMWYVVCGSIKSVPCSINSSSFFWYVKSIYSDICSHHILGLVFDRSVSLSNKIGILYLFLSVLSTVVWLTAVGSVPLLMFMFSIDSSGYFFYDCAML